jgi:hypothetical protein
MIYTGQVFPYYIHLVQSFLTSGARTPAGVEHGFSECECGQFLGTIRMFFIKLKELKNWIKYFRDQK